MNYLAYCCLICSLQFLATHSYGVSVSRPVVPSNPKCVYFTGAGIYYYWQAGAAKYMQENCDLSSIPIIGASAGALTSTLLLSGADFDEATLAAISVAEEYEIFSSKNGLAGIWSVLIREWLDRVIPEDINIDKFSNMQISVTPVLPFRKTTLITDFYNRADLIDACLASCHIPFFLDGNAYTMYRNEPVVDGSFFYFVTKDRSTSLPLPPGITAPDVFWVDYGDDEEFMSSISGNFVQLITPDDAFKMMNQGYDFMKREHREGRLPMARFAEQTVVTNLVSKALTFPRKINRMMVTSLQSVPWRSS